MNLESLFEQMKADTTKKMASILDITDSAYYPCFRSMFRNVVAALTEAQDITLFLKPLAKHFQLLEVCEFADIIPQMRPLMHCVCLVYSNSAFYNSPARIIVLMQETCNLLIDNARKYLDPGSLFQVEVEEALDKVILTLKVFNSFRSAFREFKAKLPGYFKGDKKPKTWEFQEHLIFKRFDSFVDRLNIVREFFRTAQQFLKLEKVEMGGIRGKALSSRITNVHEEFKV